MTTTPFLVIGHRGAPRMARENSLESISVALRAGADGVEIDARCLSDQSKVLFHDHDVRGGAVEEYDLAGLRGCEPALTLLHDVIEVAADAQRLLVIEVKRDGWEEELVELVGGQPNVIVSSFRADIIRRIRTLAPAVHAGIITDSAKTNALALVEELALEYYFPEINLATREIVSRARAIRSAVVPWTANHAGEWNHLRSIGCAGVITDVPDLAVEWKRSTTR